MKYCTDFLYAKVYMKSTQKLWYGILYRFSIAKIVKFGIDIMYKIPYAVRYFMYKITYDIRPHCEKLNLDPADMLSQSWIKSTWSIP